MSYEAVIGIETHVELSTKSKMFCACKVDTVSPPNTNVCPVCLGLPGAMPVMNELAVEWAMMIGHGLNCTIAPHSVMSRKNYFYPDMPKNYQISQYDLPLCIDGHLDVETDEGPRRFGVTRVHMEEDTAKSTHMGGQGGRIQDALFSLIDFNRAGTPLMEVVSEPDMRTPEEAKAYVTELREIVLALGVSDAKLEDGSMRFDANVSIRPVGQEEFGTKVEIKNMNSLRSMQQALAYEIERQTELLDGGGSVVQETRHWNEGLGQTESMRSKEEAFDYRYFPEPDLVPIAVDAEWDARVLAELPELPSQARGRFVDLGLDEEAAALIAKGDAGVLFAAAVDAGADPKTVANWLSGEVTAWTRREDKELSDTPLTGAHLAELAGMQNDGAVSASAAKEILGAVLSGEGSPGEVAESRDLMQVSDVGALQVIIDEVLAENPEAVAKLAEGDEKVLGFLVGQVMRNSGGKADPKLARELLSK
jgi:aspartyl-tRNA(Asn)/glutamyl-tRNA(Gln) amidotransferase subunit B